MEETQGHEHVTGTVEELVEALETRAEGWHWMASDRKRDRALEAAQSLREGSFSVRVGNTIYSVNADTTPDTRPAGEVPDQRDERADNPIS